MSSHEAILLFVNDELLEEAIKPLPASCAHGYRQVNRRIAMRFTALAAEGIDLIVATAGTAEHGARLYGAAHVLRQHGDTFGQRLGNAMQHAFALGYRRVVAVGNDCPSIAAADVRTAFRMLRNGGAYAAAPAADGGVFLLGASCDGFDPAAFIALPWCTPKLCRRLLRLPGAVGIPLLRRDFDSWSSPAAAEALARLLGATSVGGAAGCFPPPPHRRFRALMRPYLPCPPPAIG